VVGKEGRETRVEGGRQVKCLVHTCSRVKITHADL
jgi:hypothetical protein